MQESMISHLGTESYFLTKDGIECKIVGPCLNWKIAFIVAYGVVDKGMRIKSIGLERLEGKRLAKAICSEDGWFSPFVMNLSGFTFDISEVLGPDEVAVIMNNIANQMQKATDVGELEKLHEAATPYLRGLPLNVCEAFSLMYNTFRGIVALKGNPIVIDQEPGKRSSFILSTKDNEARKS